MNLFVNFLKIFLLELIEKNVKVEIIGFIDKLLKLMIEVINNVKEKIVNNIGLKLIFVINYGGRVEFVYSIKNMFDEFY